MSGPVRKKKNVGPSLKWQYATFMGDLTKFIEINAGGEHITQVALDFWKAGRDREEIQLHDLEAALSLSVFNNKKSGLWHTSLIDKNLVDFFVPFLPLEFRHVLLCGMAEMAAKGLEPDQDVVDQMARDLVYFPKSEKIFSGKGCKTIGGKLDYYT